MANPLPRAGKTLNLEGAHRHDAICDRFEAAYRVGPQPRIEHFLPEVPLDEQPALFTELARIELEFAAPPPSAAEYRARFPDFGRQIDALFRDPGRETAVPTGGPMRTASSPLPTLPGYEVMEFLGVGGMGVVFRARHQALDLPVAVKMVKSGGWGRAEDLARFQLEAQSVAKLNHPNVVRVFDCGQFEGVPYFTMEFVDGGPLSRRLTGDPIDPAAAAGLVETLARAMHYVHGRGIIHRDLKPGNILLQIQPNADPRSGGTDEWKALRPGTGPLVLHDLPFHPKIADFGLVKQLSGSERELTPSRAVLGTASYMAPEQAAGKTKDVGPPADIYSLGAILYELATGRPPFLAESYPLTVVQVLTEDPPRPTELVPTLPADLEAIIQKALEKDPADRYATAQDLADDLRRFRDGLPVTARPVHVLDRDARWAKKIGYEIGELVSAGRWVFVYVARQTSINRTVLLKLSTGRVGSQQHAAIRRQGEALAGLSHPNVLHLHDYGEQLGQPYLVTEYVDGGQTLGEKVRGKGGDGVGAPLPWREAAELARALALGVQAIHDHGVVHAGLCPDDVVLTKAGAPKIGGFGLARKAGVPADDGGTPAPDGPRVRYAAPEVLAGDWARVSPAADLYGLGAVLYDLLTGRPPHPSAEPGVARRAARAGPPDAPGRFADVPPSLELICLKCLEPDPARRYRSAAGLAEALREFVALADAPMKKGADNSTVMLSGGDPTPDAEVVYQLRVAAGPGRVGDAHPLPRYRIMVGRSPECDLSVPSPVVSRVHCGVVWNADTGRHEVLDYGARNGTYVNGERVRGGRPLTPGDRIQITDFVLVFEPRPA